MTESAKSNDGRTIAYARNDWNRTEAEALYALPFLQFASQGKSR